MDQSFSNLDPSKSTDVDESRNQQTTVDPKRAARDFELCEKLRKNALETASVQFMMENLRRAGCPINEDDIRCVPCEGYQILGGFQSDGSIILASNHVKTQRHVTVTVVHELIHAFDQCRVKDIEWTDCKVHACSEVRAATLSGDCNWFSEIQRLNFRFPGQFQRCVRRRAEISVKMNPSCSQGDMAKDAVDAVFDSCYNDTTPFERIP